MQQATTNQIKESIKNLQDGQILRVVINPALYALAEEEKERQALAEDKGDIFDA